jgi:ankyrin repeat protein
MHSRVFLTVNPEVFSIEVEKVIFQTKVLESVCGKKAEKDCITLRYIKYLALKHSLSRMPPKVRIIRQVADLLVSNRNSGADDRDALEACVDQLCSLTQVPFASSCCVSGFLLDDDEQPLEAHLVVAAAYVNQVSMLRTMLPSIFGDLPQQTVPMKRSVRGILALPSYSRGHFESSLFGCPVEAAATKGNVEVLVTIMDYMVEQNFHHERLRFYKYVATAAAASNGHVRLFKILLSDRWTPWVLKQLEKDHLWRQHPRRAIPRTKDPAVYQSYEEFQARKENSKRFPPLSDLDNALHYHACSGDVDMFEYLLKKRTLEDPSPKPGTGPWDNNTLREICKRGQIPILRILLRNPERFAQGEGLVACAASSGQFRTVQLLVEKGHDVNELAEGLKPALASAFDLEHTDMVRFLLDHGAVVDTKELRNSVEFAVYYKLDTMLDLAVGMGFDVPAFDPWGPWGTAKRKGCWWCTQRRHMLRDAPSPLAQD